MKTGGSKFNLDKLPEVKTTVAKQEVKYCKNCKTENNSKAKFCFECGCSEFILSLPKVDGDVKYCAKCQTKVKSSAKFCPECGSNQFITSLSDETNILEKEIDEKYEKELKKIKAKSDKLKLENKELESSNASIEKKIVSTEEMWKAKIKKIADQEQAVINKNEKVVAKLEIDKKEIKALEQEIKELDKKINDYTKKNGTFGKKVVDIAKKKSELLDEHYKLKKEKETLEKKIKDKIKAKEEAERKAKEAALLKAKQEAEYKAKKEREMAAFLAEQKRLNSPEVKFPKLLEDFRKGTYYTCSDEIAKFAKEGYAPCYYLLGLIYEYGLGVNFHNKESEARNWYMKAANTGDMRAKTRLNRTGSEYSSTVSDSILKEMAELGDGAAMMTIGRRLMAKGGYFDVSNAQIWFDKASYCGYVEALYLSAECLKKNHSNWREMFNLYKKAAERGHKQSQLIVSNIYKEGMPGFNVPKDPEKSKYWLKKYKGY